MAKKDGIAVLNEYLNKVSERERRRAIFGRISALDDVVRDFIPYYYEKARSNGVIIDGALKNPIQSNIDYYNDIMGSEFRTDKGFIESSLSKWLPRLSFKARTSLAGAMLRIITQLKMEGKNENVIKNIYVKLMCWMYYKFAGIIPELGKDDPPKILAEGKVSYHELLLLNLLNSAGCDVLIAVTGGESAYLDVDPTGKICEYIHIEGADLPEDYFAAPIAPKAPETPQQNTIVSGKVRESAVNTYLKGSDIFAEIKTSPTERSSQDGFFFNTFVKINGVEDKVTYESELMALEQYFKGKNRGLVIVEGQIPPPTNAEIAEISRGNYQTPQKAIGELSKEIKQKGELKAILDSAFNYAMGTLLSEPDITTARITTYGVSLLCWLKRYFNDLYSNWQSNISGFFFLGNKITKKEGVFLKFLSRTPVDVVIFSPELEVTSDFDDPKLYFVNNPYSLKLDRFPAPERGARVGTAAYHAERDLDTLMYQNSGIYRDKQFKAADVAVLNTTYEEIPILWDEDLKYRPNFAENGDAVTIPVIFAKISGVKKGDVKKYWETIESLMTPDTVVIKKVPHITYNTPNPIKSSAVSFIKNGRLQKEKIKSDKNYKYGFLRGAMQQHLLDTLQDFIDRKPIVGMFENGTEYTVIATALNLDTDMLRLINKFDFTKTNPKLIYIMTDEGQLSLEDTIQATFLSAVGFDVLFFVPTGYAATEKYFVTGAPQEHQRGEYIYDLKVPVLKPGAVPKNAKPRFGFFKR